MLNMNPRSELKYIRTIAESGERALGSLPGTVDEKFNPFMMPLYDKLDELLPMSQSKYLETNGFIEALPINFLRGATWNDKIIIADLESHLSVGNKCVLTGYPPGYWYNEDGSEFVDLNAASGLIKLKRNVKSKFITPNRIERHNFPVQLKWEGEIEQQKLYGTYDKEKLKNGEYYDVNCVRQIGRAHV